MLIKVFIFLIVIVGRCVALSFLVSCKNNLHFISFLPSCCSRNCLNFPNFFFPKSCFFRSDSRLSFFVSFPLPLLVFSYFPRLASLKLFAYQQKFGKELADIGEPESRFISPSSFSSSSFKPSTKSAREKKEKEYEKEKEDEKENEKRKGLNHFSLFDYHRLKDIPNIPTAEKIIAKARDIMTQVKPDKHELNIRKKVRKACAEKLDVYTRILTVDTRDAINKLKKMKNLLHPFDSLVSDLTAKNMFLEGKINCEFSEIIRKIELAKKLITATGKMYSHSAKQAASSKNALNMLDEGIGVLNNMTLSLFSDEINKYRLVHKELRRVPQVDLNSPNVVFIGSPNVGKSSLVKQLSTAKTRIDGFPFTTTKMYSGVFTQNYSEKLPFIAYLLDLPPLINRSEEKRNHMESLTIGALRFISSAVVFVFDWSKENSDKFSSIEMQVGLRNSLREKFPERPWLDVVTKSDLFFSHNAETAVSILSKLPQNALFVSSEKLFNLDKLENKICDLVLSLKNFIDTRKKLVYIKKSIMNKKQNN